VKLLDEIGSPATIANMAERFFGGVIGGALPASVAAHWLADAWYRNAACLISHPVSAYLEDLVLGWLLNLLGLPPSSGGGLCNRHTDG
jgi:aromatic-L-amino-acid decarboxylase